MVSKRGTNGLIPKGAYLTIEESGNKYILRVIESTQNDVYSPAPLLADMDIQPLIQDRKCQNIILASRVKDFVESHKQQDSNNEANDAIDNILNAENSNNEAENNTVNE